MNYQLLKQIEQEALNLARHIQQYGAASSVVVLKAQVDLIRLQVSELYDAVLGEATK